MITDLHLITHVLITFKINYKKTNSSLDAFILVNPKVMHETEKVWIPSELHRAGEMVIQDYIKKVLSKGGKKSDPAKVVRCAVVTPSRGPSYDEAFIPNALLADGNGSQKSFPMYVEAFPTKAEALVELKNMRIKNQSVDYRTASWGVKGDQPPKP